MNFNKHYDQRGQHAFLSPSNPAWLRYDDEKLQTVYTNHLNVLRGTKLHEFAANSIDLGIKLQKSGRTLNRYVNDSIGYAMTPEQVLFYSPNCYGTADAIQFRNNVLRIFDLKTGVTPPHPEQLEIYAALFCLEYGYKPEKIGMDLRLYQNDDVNQWEPDPDDIRHHMEIIKKHDTTISKLILEDN